MDLAWQTLVHERAAGRCEYCQLPQAVYGWHFPIDHVIARQHGGLTALGNLALACPACNRHKGPNIAGIDPLSGQLTRLLNPRTDRWGDHLQWNGPFLIGLTAIGRTTVVVLAVNDPDRVALRSQLMAEGNTVT